MHSDFKLKIIIMKNHFLILITLVYFSIGCNNTHSQKENPTNQSGFIKANCTKFKFLFNNEDFNSFGKKFFKNDLPISPKSIAIYDEWIYIIDTYHNNIKRIDYNKNNLKSSKILSKDNIWLNDIIVFNNKLYIISEIDSLYIYDFDLNLIERKWLNKGEGKFYKLYNDSLIISYPAEKYKFITINSKDEIINVSHGYRSKKDLSHGKFCIRDVENSIIETAYGKFVLNQEYKYEGANLDFDEKKISFFNTDSNYIYINVCKY